MSSGTVADWVARFLSEQGVEFAFSHPGGPLLPIYDSMRRGLGPKNILVRHEGAGAFMAEAYAKLTGKMGVCMSTMGPGAANMTIGVGTAMSDSTPVLAITGQLVLGNFGKGYQQETDHNALFRGITKASIQLKQAESAPEWFERAYRIAFSGRQGPVHVDVPVDIAGTALQSQHPLRVVRRYRYGPARAEDVAEAARLIASSTTPVILAGGGVISGEASRELQQFAEVLSIPVATSYNGRGSIPEDHPLALGRLGENTPKYARTVAGLADLLIAVGYRFTDVSLDHWKPKNDVKIVQIDADPAEIGKSMPVSCGLAGDAAATLDALLSALKKSGKAKSRSKWVRQVDDARREWRRAYASIQRSDAVPLKPQRVMKEVAAAMGKKSIVVSGAGRAKMWAASVLPIYGPRTWIHSGGYAVMGYEVPAALACSLARPTTDVLCVGGDASFQMHCQEIATAVEHHARFVSVVLNDGFLGSIRNIQLKKYSAVFGTDLQLDVNLAEVAKSFGGEGSRITRPSEIQGAVKEAMKSEKPVVLDVKVDGMEVPTFEY